MCYCNYDDFSVTNRYNNGAFDYSVTLYLESGTVWKTVDASTAGKKEGEDFIEMLRTGKMSHTYEEFAIPVYYMNAVKEAYETGKNAVISF